MTSLLTLPLEIPSPPQDLQVLVELGVFKIRAYSMAIMLGIVAAVWITARRWAARGGNPDTVLEISFWAVPFGIAGGRIYHVISTPDPYFGPNGDLSQVFRVWEGGLGIWGAIALGALGAWIGARRARVRLVTFADAAAPGILVAQAIGRLGNWFNQELFGSPTTLPWGLRIDPDSPTFPGDTPPDTLFHPTFLYELLWNLGAAVLLVWLDRRRRWGHGRVFWAYVALYTAGRLWIELLRIDPAETVLGLRVNVWTSIVVGLGALVAFVIVGRRHPVRETSPALPTANGADAVADDDAEGANDADDVDEAEAAADPPDEASDDAADDREDDTAGGDTPGDSAADGADTSTTSTS